MRDFDYIMIVLLVVMSWGLGALSMATYQNKRDLPLHERIRYVEDKWYDCAAHINNAFKRRMTHEPWSHFYRGGDIK